MFFSELGPILKQVHLLTSEMVHFIHQMQYYILFEVLECSWDVLIKQVQQAEALDDIISAHQNFLLTVKAGALLDDNSQVCNFHNIGIAYIIRL
jgi:gamma-tubulin complex component 3